jgi:hypothetical protein
MRKRERDSPHPNGIQSLKAIPKTTLQPESATDEQTAPTPLLKWMTREKGALVAPVRRTLPKRSTLEAKGRSKNLCCFM